MNLTQKEKAILKRTLKFIKKSKLDLNGETIKLFAYGFFYGQSIAPFPPKDFNWNSALEFSNQLEKEWYNMTAEEYAKL